VDPCQLKTVDFYFYLFFNFQHGYSWEPQILWHYQFIIALVPSELCDGTYCLVPLSIVCAGRVLPHISFMSIDKISFGYNKYDKIDTSVSKVCGRKK
jgi:hypothetical protein